MTLSSAPIAAFSLAVLLACVASPAWSETQPSSGGAAPVRAAVAIKNIIPHRVVGAEACFAGTFSGRTIDMQDWSKTRSLPTGQVDTNGKPVVRSVPEALPAQDIAQIALHLTYHNRLREGSFDLMFTLFAESKSLKTRLRARSGCTWSGWDGEKQTQPETKLSCWVECDGGGMTVERIPDTGDLNLRFHALAMQPGCDGGGRFRVGIGEASERVNFRLERVSLRLCKDLKVWGHKQWPVR